MNKKCNAVVYIMQVIKKTQVRYLAIIDISVAHII